MKYRTCTSINISRLLSKSAVYLLPILAIGGGIVLGNKSTKTPHETPTRPALLRGMQQTANKETQGEASADSTNPGDADDRQAEMVSFLKGDDTGNVAVSPDKEALETIPLTKNLNESEDQDQEQGTVGIELPTTEAPQSPSLRTRGCFGAFRHCITTISGWRRHSPTCFWISVAVLVFVIIAFILWATGLLDPLLIQIYDAMNTPDDAKKAPDDAMNTPNDVVTTTDNVVTTTDDVVTTTDDVVTTPNVSMQAQCDAIKTPDKLVPTSGDVVTMPREISTEGKQPFNVSGVDCSQFPEITREIILPTGVKPQEYYLEPGYQDDMMNIWPKGVFPTHAEHDALKTEIFDQIECQLKVPILDPNTAVKDYLSVRMVCDRLTDQT